MTRRRLLAASVGGSLSLLSGCSETTRTSGTEPASTPPTQTSTTPVGTTDRVTVTEQPEPVFETYVERTGTDFTVDGAPFYFSGANNTWLPVQFEAADGTIDEILGDAQALGINVIRTLTYGDGMPGGFQPNPREYNERKFRRMDRVVHEAGQRGIRLILPLVNGYGKDYTEGLRGGMDQYVDWSPTAQDHNDFYTDEYCRSLYRDFVEQMLTRENTINGLEYREDPTIMMWELANEPHVRSHRDPENGMTAADHEKLQKWIDDMAKFIKKIDLNHLVSTGSGGLYGDETFSGTGNRTAYLSDHRSNAIDAASFHLYPGYDVDSAEWIKAHVEDAHEELGKPAYLGEFGAANIEKREALFDTVYDAARDHGVAGAAFWQLIGHDGRTGDLRTPSNPSNRTAATARFVYYPESTDVVPTIKGFSDAMNKKAET